VTLQISIKECDGKVRTKYRELGMSLRIHDAREWGGGMYGGSAVFLWSVA
jgi:hypothetical protein